jgi:hypothetical protein
MPKEREWRCAYYVNPRDPLAGVRCSTKRDPELKHACKVHADLIREMR